MRFLFLVHLNRSQVASSGGSGGSNGSGGSGGSGSSGGSGGNVRGGRGGSGGSGAIVMFAFVDINFKSSLTLTAFCAL